MRIGLYGGSFNPPHEGHRLVSLTALGRLGLDRVWWLVTPGNPLKNTTDLTVLHKRMAQCRKMADHPRVEVTGFEQDIRARYTLDTIMYLKSRYPRVFFVWIMGADNLATFHRWRGWREIAATMPMAIIDRPGMTLKALNSRAAQTLSQSRLPENEALSLATNTAPAWVFLHGPRSSLSSTQIRERPTVNIASIRSMPLKSVG